MNRRILASITLLLCSAEGAAEIQFNGFATIAANQLFDDSANYRGFSDELDFKGSSLFAIQATSDLNDDLSATAQIVARGENNFSAEFEWAYVSYNINDNTNVKMGKLRLPTYYYSEYLDVSYAYHWIIPPVEVYASNFTSYNGFSVYTTGSLGDFEYALQVGHGAQSNSFEAVGDVDVRYDIIANFDVSYGAWSSKLIYFANKIDLTNPALIQVEQLFVEPQFSNSFQATDKDTYIAGISSYLDFEKFKVGFEYAKLDFDGINFVFADEDRFMITGVYRFSPQITLHYTLSTVDRATDFDTLPMGDPRYSIVRGLAGNTSSDDTTHTFGFRYDFHESAAFKFDFGTTKNDFAQTGSEFARTGIVVVF